MSGGQTLVLLLTVFNLYLGGSRPAESWGCTVAQKQLWQEGSC